MQTSCIQFLKETTQKFPNATAVTSKDKNLTFLELSAAAQCIGNLLPTDKRNRPVAVFLPKSCDSIVSFMAVLYTGNFYAPIDVKSPLERIQKVFKNLSPIAIITNSTLANNIANILPDCPIILIDKIEFGHSNCNAPNGWESVIDTDPVYCIYTSGSTGDPKGVLISHRGVMDYISWAVETYPVDNHSRIANQAPFHFDNSTLDIYLMLCTGACLYLVPESYFSFPARLLDYLHQNRITFIFWVPSVLLNISNLDILKNRNLPDLKLVLFAGEVMPTKCLNHWRRHLPRALFSNLYGPTEITVDCTFYIVNREFSDAEPLPIGVPCRNTGILLLNENNQLVRDEEIGELCVRGSGLALGYWNAPDKTNASFTQNPLNNSYPELIYRTGDLAKYNEHGELIFIGRKDSQIKHLGHRIELGEIETACCSIIGISSCCVLYENSQIICFYVSACSKLEESEIRIQLAKLLPQYMIPHLFHRIDRMPLNANGKIDRLALKNNLQHTSLK
jgi:D-alanine--poly(phosphoribitol) ligase subunit 1